MADLSFGIQFMNVTYGDDDLTNDSAIRDQPFLKKMGMPEVKGGSTVEEKFYLAPPRGFSGNLTDAQQRAAASGSKHLKWQHPFGEHVGSIQVDIPDIIQSKPDQAAANQALEAETDRGMAQEGQNISDKLLGRAGLAYGVGEYEETASGDYPTFCIRFTDPSDARNFQVDDQIVIAAADGDTEGDLVGETGVVVGRDIGVGYIRVASLDDTDTPANPGGWVDDVTYYVFALGEHGDGDPDQIITSYERFLPGTVQTSTLHNVDRSVDSSTCGARLPSNLDTGPLVKRTKRLATIMHSRLGLKRSDCKDYMAVYNPEDHETAGDELTAGGKRDLDSGTTEEGYESFKVRTSFGTIDFVADPSKNKGSTFLMNMRLAKCYSASGKWFETIKDGGGNIVQLMPGVNRYEIRTISKIATGIGAPYMHGRHSTTVS